MALRLQLTHLHSSLFRQTVDTTVYMNTRYDFMERNEMARKLT